MLASNAEPGRPRESKVPWIGVSVVVVALLGTAGAILANVGQGPRPPFLSEALTPQPPQRRNDTRVHVAGSGSCVPLVRALAVEAAGQGLRAPEVHASIGSGGGLRALRDGAIDVALVSRPLRAAEREQGLVYTPFARIPVVVGAHLDVPVAGVTSQALTNIFAGEQTSWSDGSRIVVLQREEGDSSHRVLREVLPVFGAADDASRAAKSFRVLYHDASMQVALANTPGAVGLHGNGVDPRLAGFRALEVDGVLPTAAAVADGDYPFSKELAFVTAGPPAGKTRDFLEFTRSAAGHALLDRRGAMPVTAAEGGAEL